MSPVHNSWTPLLQTHWSYCPYSSYPEKMFYGKHFVLDKPLKFIDTGKEGRGPQGHLLSSYVLSTLFIFSTLCLLLAGKSPGDP